jgi:hypothetical protein
MARCPDCGATLPAAATTCPACGYRLDVPSQRCTRCGEQVAIDADACLACGLNLAPTVCSNHPDRQATGRCVICGSTLCDECNQGAGPAFQCARHAAIPVLEGWAQVYTTSDDIQAELIRDNLHAEGLDAQILSQKDHFSFTVDLGNLSPVRVLVPAFAFQDAARVVRDHMDRQGEVAFACPDCGEAYDPGQPACTVCGHPLS